MANDVQRAIDIIRSRRSIKDVETKPVTIAVPKTFTRKAGVKTEFVIPETTMLEKQTEDVLNARNAFDIINGIFEFADETIPAQDTTRKATVSAVGRMIGRTQVARFFGAADSGARDFELTKNAFGTLMARGLGERGVVTNRDVARILNAMPREDDTHDERARRKRFVLGLVQLRIQRYNDTVKRVKQSVKGIRIGAGRGGI